MKIRCNNCESIFDQRYLTFDNDCPVCGVVGELEYVAETENYRKFRDTLVDNISIVDMVNFDEGNNDDGKFDYFIHNVIRELLTDKKCPHCDAPLYCSDLPQYDYICIECEENFYKCEVK